MDEFPKNKIILLNIYQQLQQMKVMVYETFQIKDPAGIKTIVIEYTFKQTEILLRQTGTRPQGSAFMIIQKGVYTLETVKNDKTSGDRKINMFYINMRVEQMNDFVGR